MRAAQCVSAAVVAGALLIGPSTASAQETPQALRQEIDQLRRDFETLKQQYGDRLAALEAKLAAAEGAPTPAAAPATPAATPTTAQVPAGAAGAGGPSGALPV
jgi:Tfp pilus assembly protein PilN